MIPNNKKIAVLHPFVKEVWWAVKMMIYLSNFLQEKNEVILYTFFYSKKTFQKEKINFQIKSYFSKWFFKIFSFFIIAFKIRKKDYIIVWNSPMHFVWIISKTIFFSKAKIIWWNHHYPWYYSNNANIFIRLKRIIEKLVVKKIDKIVANSKWVKLFIDKIWKIKSQILNPVLDEEFLNNNFKTIKNKQKIIFTYGRRVEWKNLELIFYTYEKLKNEISDLILIVWWSWKELIKFKEKYKKNRNVKILWRLDKYQIWKNLNISKVFLFPSLIDSFWIVKIEAMSIWIPVVCFWKNNEEIIKNWNNWFFVKSEKDFLEKTKKILLLDFKKYKILSKNCLSTVKNYWIKNFEKQLENIFKF